MAARTAWTGGNLNGGLGWTGLFSSSDLLSMANGLAVRSSLADITNGTGLDQFMDISLIAVCNQTTTTAIAAGANISFYIYPLLQDGATYGDGLIPTAGASGGLAITPLIPIAAVMNVRAGISSTTFAGISTGILLPPGSFRAVIQNNTGVSWAGSSACYFRSYNINLNN
jgi:hypothetical protein